MALTTVQSGMMDSVAQYYTFKNRIINGAMVIDQRNAGASITPTTGQFSVDRWTAYLTQASKYTLQQNAGSVTPPVGFINYLGATSSSAYSVTSTDYFLLRQGIEGLNVADLAWGTASAATVTLSFWVRSSLTGTFGGSVTNNGNSRCYPFSYIISAANTWEQKSITIAGDTTGTWLTTNGIGINVAFSLGAGSTVSGTSGAWIGTTNILSATGATSVVGTNGATFYITGVQLEKGSTATSFDYRPYSVELSLCQRYLPVLEANSVVSGFASTATIGYFSVPFKVTARVPATGLTVIGGGSMYSAAGANLAITGTNFIAAGTGSCFIQGIVASGMTAGQGTLYYGPNLLFNGCEL